MLNNDASLAVQVVSDLRIDLLAKTPDDWSTLVGPPPFGVRYHVLVLAGNICSTYNSHKTRRLYKFLSWCNYKYYAVIYVPGNYEYNNPKFKQHHTRSFLKEKLQSICSTNHNIHFLDEDVADVKGVRFIAASDNQAWLEQQLQIVPDEQKTVVISNDQLQVSDFWIPLNQQVRQGGFYLEFKTSYIELSKLFVSEFVYLDHEERQSFMQ